MINIALFTKTEHCKDIPLYIQLQFKKKPQVSKAVVYIALSEA